MVSLFYVINCLLVRDAHYRYVVDSYGVMMCVISTDIV